MASIQSDSDWPFIDPKNVAVFTVADIMNRVKPILYVSHDADDGAWQFMPGGRISIHEAKTLALHRIVEGDPTIKQLADLPEGWVAQRSSPKAPWRGSKRKKRHQ